MAAGVFKPRHLALAADQQNCQVAIADFQFQGQVAKSFNWQWAIEIGKVLVPPR
jgi:hypothetical protein